ncbi:oxidosqualene cyclase [Aureococcus anophagefferens]|nr:oxidosqualene cyclase [Aureococcus anophagefferens]
MDFMSIDLAAGVCGFAASALMSKSRSVPPLCYTRVGMVLCGSGAALALRCKGAAKAGIASVAGAGCLLLFARWDNARGARAEAAAAATSFVLGFLASRDGVSHPAPAACAHRRLPSWDASRKREAIRGWKCATGDASHAATDGASATLQCDDGHWGGDYGGPHFLSPGLVVVWYVTGRRDDVLDEHQRRAMVRYYENHQQTDGGWGTHVESPSTMFGSVLTYVALRLLGEPADAPACAAGRKLILEQGGACYTSSWAKFALCLLGAMDWEGHESVPPEMWLLPCWCPFHPCRMWCHARMVYLPMGYLWGKRWTYENADSDPVVLALRDELYPASPAYGAIPWRATRSWVAPMDDYSPVHPLMVAAQRFLRVYEDLGGPLRRYARRKGLAFSADYCRAEDLQTNYVCIGPVNKVYNMLVAYDDRHADGGEAHARHALRVPDYLWVAEDGMKMQGYNGSQCWDASFATQAIAESDLGDDARFRDCAKKAWSYLERTQILSTTTSQASPAFAFEKPELRENTSATRADGGYATYENTRGYGWYEWLNPSEVFGDIMIDYSYVECSMASNGALARSRGRADGSWYGSWACCFTYAGWFGIEGLVDSGEDPKTSEPVARACAFLLRHQRPNGGWGEDFTSCFDKAYAKNGMEAYGDAEGAGVTGSEVAWKEFGVLPPGDWRTAEGPASSVIVGGGPAGMATAIMFAKRGWRNVVVVDRLGAADPATRRSGATARFYLVGLGARGQRSLAALGAWDDVERYCAAVVGRKDWAPGAGPDEGAERIFTDRPYTTQVIARDRLAGALYRHALDTYPDAISFRHGVDVDDVTESAVVPRASFPRPRRAPGTARTVAMALEDTGRGTRITRYADDNERIFKTVPLKLPADWRGDINYSAADDALAREDADAGELRALLDKELPQFSPDADADGARREEAVEPVAGVPLRRAEAAPRRERRAARRRHPHGEALLRPGRNAAFEDVAELDAALSGTARGSVALAAFSAKRGPEAKALVQISRGLDRPGVLGFVTFILPIILDSVFHAALPRVFGPNVIASLQQDGTFVDVRRRKRRDRLLQAGVIGSCLAAADSAVRHMPRARRSPARALVAAGVAALAVAAAKLRAYLDPALAPADVLTKSKSPVTTERDFGRGSR